MRAVDLAVYADVLAGRAATLAARLERVRDGVRQTAIERSARRALPSGSAERLERIGALGTVDARALRREAAELAEDLAALEELQAWVEARLFEAREDAAA